MATELIDLWPSDISTNVLSPAVILNFQASRLEAKTNGILIAVVDRSEGTYDPRGDYEGGQPITQADLDVSEIFFVEYRFAVIAPALKDLRTEILSVCHELNRVYPAYLDAPGLKRDDTFAGRTVCAAATQEEFTQRLAEGLQSSHVQSILHSMIAMSNEVSSE